MMLGPIHIKLSGMNLLPPLVSRYSLRYPVTTLWYVFAYGWTGKFYADRGTRFVISGFRREFYEICTLLGYYAASSGNFLPTVRDNLSVP